MAFLWFLLVALAGAVIGLVIYVREKPKTLQKEIERLRKSIVSEGKSFEQIEHRIENLKNSITEKKKLAETKKVKNADLICFLDDIEKQLNEMLKQLFSDNSVK
jgi:cell division protein FtsL